MQSYLVPLDVQFLAWSMLHFHTMSVKELKALAILGKMPKEVWNLICLYICFFNEWSINMIYIFSFSQVLLPHSDKAPTIYIIHFRIRRGPYMLCIIQFIKQVEEKRWSVRLDKCSIVFQQ